jgi:hypothetical protein
VAGGSWTGNVYGAGKAGNWSVQARYSGLTASATLVVYHGGAVSISIEPARADITAGSSIAYSLLAADAEGNAWEATSDATWSIETAAGGSWTGSTYVSFKAGSWNVSSAYSGLLATAVLGVSHAAATGLDVEPPYASVRAGESVLYQCTAHDAYGNAWNVTSSSSWSVDEAANGSWSGPMLTTSRAGTFRVTSAYAGMTGNAILNVRPGPLHRIGLEIPGNVVSGQSFNATVTAYDAFGNVVTDFAGTVHFSSSDRASGVRLPANYTFQAADAGRHVFANGITLITTGAADVQVSSENVQTAGSTTLVSQPSGGLEMIWVLPVIGLLAALLLLLLLRRRLVFVTSSIEVGTDDSTEMIVQLRDFRGKAVKARDECHIIISSGSPSAALSAGPAGPYSVSASVKMAKGSDAVRVLVKGTYPGAAEIEARGSRWWRKGKASVTVRSK